MTGLVLGYIGLDLYTSGRQVTRSVPDLLYDDLALLAFSTGGIALRGQLPWQFQVARFLLPIVVVYGAFTGLVTLFRERFDQARLPFLRRHVIVVGLGEMGLAFAQALRTEGATVVAIESDAISPNLAAARDLGVITIIGDGRDRAVLSAAGLRRARHLLVTADDAANVEVVIQAQRLTERRSARSLECLAHVVDLELCVLLKSNALTQARGEGFTVDFFNFYDQAARVVCSAAPFSPEHVVVVGSGALAEQIILQSIRDHTRSEPAAALDITLINRDAAVRVEALNARHPLLKTAARFRPIEVTLDVGLVHAIPILPEGARAALIYICDSDGISTALALRLKDVARSTGSEIVVCTSRVEGLASVLAATGGDSGLEHVTVVGLAQQTCTAELVGRGIYELLGRATHEAYVRSRQSEGWLGSEDASLAPWDELDDSLRASNRAQAQHIGVKLRAMHCALVPVEAIEPEAFVFRDGEVELLARMEHDRWVAERKRAGWRLGDERSPSARTTPYLVPWEELPEEIQDRDRETVYRLPFEVADAGFGIVRLDLNAPAT